MCRYNLQVPVHFTINGQVSYGYNSDKHGKFAQKKKLVSGTLHCQPLNTKLYRKHTNLSCEDRTFQKDTIGHNS